MPTARIWEHPHGGSFTYANGAWTGKVSAPGFDTFAYDSGYRDADLGMGEYELSFEANDEADIPSDAAVAVAAEVVGNPSQLVSLIARTLWNDFNGQGPDSGMWWHGDLEMVCEGLEPAPEGPDDLPGLMRLNRIMILQKIEEYQKPVARFDFAVAFDPEHGVSILTDGRTVLGAGNEIDVSPYESR